MCGLGTVSMAFTMKEHGFIGVPSLVINLSVTSLSGLRSLRSMNVLCLECKTLLSLLSSLAQFTGPEFIKTLSQNM